MLRRPLTAFLAILLICALVRLGGFVQWFGSSSLQMDFSAFYTAGEAVKAGLSPYRNHYLQTPPIWDGVDEYRHSRFLYPPLAATFFQLWTLLPYHAAKQLWMLVNIAGIAIAVGLSARAAGARMSRSRWLAVALVTVTFHPLLTLLERGQIDGVSFVLVAAAVTLICTDTRPGLAGSLLAVATLLKLQVALVVPFLLVRGRKGAVLGFAAAAAALVALSVATSGSRALTRYATVEFPRISAFGEEGPPELLADRATIAALRPSSSLTVKAGRTYAPAVFAFTSNASLVRTGIGDALRAMLGRAHLPDSISVASLLVFSLGFAVVALLQWRRRSAGPWTRNEEFLYWQLALVVVLLAAPLTWVMNTVWLLALVPVTLSGLADHQRSWTIQLGLALVALGLTLAAVPDHQAFPLLFPGGFPAEVAANKYVLAQGSIATGLALQLSRPGMRAPA